MLLLCQATPIHIPLRFPSYSPPTFTSLTHSPLSTVFNLSHVFHSPSHFSLPQSLLPTVLIYNILLTFLLTSHSPTHSSLPYGPHSHRVTEFISAHSRTVQTLTQYCPFSSLVLPTPRLPSPKLLSHVLTLILLPYICVCFYFHSKTLTLFSTLPLQIYFHIVIIKVSLFLSRGQLPFLPLSATLHFPLPSPLVLYLVSKLKLHLTSTVQVSKSLSLIRSLLLTAFVHTFLSSSLTLNVHTSLFPTHSCLSSFLIRCLPLSSSSSCISACPFLTLLLPQ